ncbi:MAG: hypothetical protein HKN13_05885 [Rhodothermales bacterium]|nr:hypothetical protein [Rhodothermales bacterium]
MNKGILILGIAVVFVAGCDVFGSKDDATTDEIFDAGRSDIGLLDEVEYVPLFPFFTQSAAGSQFNAPTDVYVGFDEFIYVTDQDGLHVLEESGRTATFFPIPGGATSVIQDRLLNVFVTARRDTLVGGRTWSLPVVLKYTGIARGERTLSNIIWHPFDDDTRSRRDPEDADELVEFTGVAVMASNSIYVSRRGPNNNAASVLSPHNSILEFNSDGLNVQRLPLSPALPSLRSSVSPSDVLTFVQPPQRESLQLNRSFIVAQQSETGLPLQFAVLSLIAVETTDGIDYQTDSQKLQTASFPERGDGFLYDEFRFDKPSGLAFAGDASQYLFVVDSGKDSLFVFTNTGVEGVAAPAGSRSTIPVRVSFGGTGDGSKQFNSPQGVAYANQIVYVADRGNNRISRFRLNTDFE